MKNIKPLKAFSKADAIFLFISIFALKFLHFSISHKEFHYKNIYITEAANFLAFWSILIFVILGVIAMLYCFLFIDGENKLEENKKKTHIKISNK